MEHDTTDAEAVIADPSIDIYFDAQVTSSSLQLLHPLQQRMVQGPQLSDQRRLLGTRGA